MARGLVRHGGTMTERARRTWDRRDVNWCGCRGCGDRPHPDRITRELALDMIEWLRGIERLTDMPYVAPVESAVPAVPRPTVLIYELHSRCGTHGPFSQAVVGSEGEPAPEVGAEVCLCLMCVVAGAAVPYWPVIRVERRPLGGDD